MTTRQPDIATIAELYKASGGTFDLEVHGTSMGATFHGASAVRIDPRPGFDVGDVVAFRDAKDVVVAHRVAAQTATHAITLGDAHVIPDPPVPKRHVLGKVVSTISSGNVEPIRDRPPETFIRVLVSRLLVALALLTSTLHPRIGQAVVRLLLVARFVCWKIIRH